MINYQIYILQFCEVLPSSFVSFSNGTIKNVFALVNQYNLGLAQVFRMAFLSSTALAFVKTNTAISWSLSQVASDSIVPFKVGFIGGKVGRLRSKS